VAPNFHHISDQCFLRLPVGPPCEEALCSPANCSSSRSQEPAYLSRFFFFFFPFFKVISAGSYAGGVCPYLPALNGGPDPGTRAIRDKWTSKSNKVTT
jgi:hypothetical protein